ncbi:GGDEF domain-containing protein [Vibrio renipiscarius]|uniref:diguanylate cyclase n=1 Tax=Vibrio renipiscarius TaxID=1461322 RepID=A0A0C2JFT5_9VIBR|nr:GGDEF domain-containing protein [Vibrio renipiscarius]KII76819.1 diguanylate cyclase [Vibrio renipiscarius]KII76947.1 diguanylate cyclase [Vibrio renipiscarius]
MGALEQDIQSQLHHLKSQLEQVRLTQRDSSFKHRREQQVLQRLLTSLSDACATDDPRLLSGLLELKVTIEKQKDISTLIPKLVILERLIKQHTVVMDKHKKQLDSQVKHAGETLLRVAGIPSKIKRDLRDLLSFCARSNTAQSEQAIKLLAIYERSIKIFASNPDHATPILHNDSSRELLNKLNDELQQLITELDFTGESGEQLSDIRAKLLLGVSTQSLLEETLHILKLVVQGTNSERKTSQQFLSQVNESLASSLKSSAQITDQSLSYFEQRVEHGKELHTLISESHSLLRESSSIEAAQQSLSPLFDQLSSLSERLKYAEQREKALIERMQFGHGQLESLAETTQDYRRRLDDQAERIQQDPLTRVLNRTAFNEKMEIEYRRWIRNQHNLRVVQFDIDGFKAVNDSFGYTAGDKALKIIARCIKSDLANTDIIARYSGEEFVVIFPDRVDSESLELVKSIQTQISRLPFKFRENNLNITLSVASTVFKHSDTPEEVLERLRVQLQESKKIGTNQFIWT